ncbi:hypothetical protein FNF27_06749 [Cafeteria roenbergensis]|uniref:Semialdehyde dehydrogenase NAD-binding domain-containing protein n=1 Tax=Cafeteria roenbergensis TaxID=33653 RepID=A0A5A8DZW9_CAFRO|nr:hypothetical protein FNF27_06749 [Cafeteria roenbergensis]
MLSARQCVTRASRSAQRGVRAAVAAAAGAPSANASSAAAGASGGFVRFAAELDSVADADDFVRAYGPDSQSRSSANLAVVKIGGEVLQRQLEELVDNVRFMREAGMNVVLVHGGGPQLNEELARRQVEPTYKGGHRVTDAETLKIAERVFAECTQQLVAALEGGGISATGLSGNVFRAKQAEGGALGFVGEITGVEMAAIDETLRSGRVPVLNSLGIDETAGSALNINADVAAREVARETKPSRVVFLSAGGGWKEDGVVVPELSMEADFARLEARDYTGRQGTLLKLREVKAITDALPPSSSVTICSPADLTRQLVPHRGPGTQIRRGAKASVFTPGAADDAAITAALTEAHGRPTTAASIADRHGARVLAIVATANHNAVAVVTETHLSPTPHDPVPEGSFAAPRLSAFVARRQGLDDAAEPARNAQAINADGLDEEQKAELLARAAVGVMAAGTGGDDSATPRMAVDGLIGEGMFLPSGGGSGAAMEGKGLARHPCIMWWGMAGVFEVEEAVQTAQRARARAAAADADTAPAHPADDTATDVSVPSQPGSAAGGRALPTEPATSVPRRDVVLVGARGYTGRELVTLLAGHSGLRVGAATSRAFEGLEVAAALDMDRALAARACAPGLRFSAVSAEDIAAGHGIPSDMDPAAFILALPNGHSDAYHTAIRSSFSSAPVLDLSADQRFNSEWVYGMPERPGARAAIVGAKDISNPGCYATAVQVGLMPFAQPHLNPAGGSQLSMAQGSVAMAFGVSGYSGAGVTPSDKNNPEVLRDNLLPYALVGHIHEREATHHLGVQVAFSPTVAPFFRGISATLSVFLDKDAAAAMADARPDLGSKTATRVAALAAEQARAFFASGTDGPEPLVRVSDGEINVRTHGSNCSGVTVGGFVYEPVTGRLGWVSCIDNLGKGAAVQALQNINIALGLPELEGIVPDAPLRA